MSTKHVILALLDIQPMSGYELLQKMEISLDSLWAATYSQIYPMLHKLEQEGLVAGTLVPGERQRQRTEYTLTDVGRAELRDWYNQPVQYLPFRDPFKLWATYIDVAEPAVVFANIDAHLALHTQRAADLDAVADQIEDGSHPLIQARALRLPPERVQAIQHSRALVFRELAQQARQEVASAQRLRAYAAALYPDDDPHAA